MPRFFGISAFFCIILRNRLAKYAKFVSKYAKIDRYTHSTVGNLKKLSNFAVVVYEGNASL
jgi:hypothetical protein